ncbi:acetate kinase, partial [Thermodesulfobacteriota bacterium]
DMREVIEKADSGDERAGVALDVYTYRIKKYIGAYHAALGCLNAIIFTAGIGENSPFIREHACQGLEKLGIEIDPKKNDKSGEGVWEISTTESEVKVLVVPTNEELRIAQETKRAVSP